MLLKLKAALLLEDFNKISTILFENEGLVKKLSVKEFNEIVRYAILNNKRILLNCLLKEANEEQKNKIFDYIFYMEGSTYKLSSLEYVSYFEELIRFLISDNNIKMIYDVANTVSKVGDTNLDTSVLKEFLMNREVDDLTADLASMPLYNSSELEEKILEGEAIYIVEYAVNVDNKKEFLKKLFMRGDVSDVVEELAKESKIDQKFYTLVLHNIIKYTIDLELKSKYLYILFLETSNVYHHDYIVEQILLLNDFKTIKELMPKLCMEEQVKYSKKAIEDNNNSLILTLACTTKSEMTMELINNVIDRDQFNEIVFMVGHLSGDYIYKALEAILYQKKASYYLKLIDSLYLLGFNNWMAAIGFITVNKLEYLFETSALMALCRFKKAKKKEMTRNRKK